MRPEVLYQCVVCGRSMMAQPGKLRCFCGNEREFDAWGVSDSLAKVQYEQVPWRNYNFGDDKETPDWHSFLGVVEEVGELARTYIKSFQHIRGDAREHEEKARDAVADILIFCLGLCSKRGWDASQLLMEVWRGKVRKRDWRRVPADGGAGEC